jgi:hypothetical protein
MFSLNPFGKHTMAHCVSLPIYLGLVLGNTLRQRVQNPLGRGRTGLRLHTPSYAVCTTALYVQGSGTVRRKEARTVTRVRKATIRRDGSGEQGLASRHAASRPSHDPPTSLAAWGPAGASGTRGRSGGVPHRESSLNDRFGGQEG